MTAGPRESLDEPLAGKLARRQTNALIRKLEVVEGFLDEDRAVLTRLCARTRAVPARRDVIEHGDPPDDVHLVLEGILIRYKMMPEGKRQIVAVLLPGDFCDLHVALLGAMDHSIAALTPCTIVDIPASAIRDLTENHPRIIRALWWATLVDEGTLREWLASVAQRDANKRMAHFFCELLLRLQQVGLAEEASFGLPFTQTDLGDVLGITNVHANRTLQELRETGLIVLEKRRLTIPNVKRLMAFCSFDPAYLHLHPRQN